MGIISWETEMSHSSPHFTQDLCEVFYSDRELGMVVSRMESGHWTKPEMIPGLAGKLAGDLFLSPDGNRLFFHITERRGGTYDENIWYMDRRNGKWSEPKSAGEAINSGHIHWQNSVADDGTLYFSSERPGGLGGTDIYLSKSVNGTYPEIENLGRPINSEQGEGTPFIAPDQSYLLFSSGDRPDVFGKNDLYISIRAADGSWGVPENLGNLVNTQYYELCPYISPDGKYLFFISNRPGEWHVYWIKADTFEHGRALSRAPDHKDQAEITNSLGMEFKLIKAGVFTMGTDDKNAWEFDKHAHRVTITKDYYISDREVTQAQFERIMGINPSVFKGPDRPVDSVSCAQAIEFCKRLSELEGIPYRLPYEAEWEYACRAGTATAFYWGDNPAQADGYEWHKGNSGNQTHPVGLKKPNPWGLYDMSGNVQEFCLDYFGLYSAEPQVDPRGPSSVGSNGLDCTLRGGYYCNHEPNNLRSTHRHGYVRNDPENNSFFGFRVVRETH